MPCQRQRWWTSLSDAAHEPDPPGALFMRRWLEEELTMMELFIMRLRTCPRLSCGHDQMG